MANTAVLAKLTIVIIVFFMAGEAIRRRALEDIINMAFFARHRAVRTQQLEVRKAVIKSGRFPGIRAMTGAALLTKTALMKIVFLVTGKTI